MRMREGTRTAPAAVAKEDAKSSLPANWNFPASGAEPPEDSGKIALFPKYEADANAPAPVALDTGGEAGLRVNWQLKTIWPVAVVLLAGMLLFLLSTVSFQETDRHRVLVIAGAGAVAICGVIIVVLASTIQRPMIELQDQIERVGKGDLGATVSFARRNDEIGDLGRNFNRMVEQLRESREEIEHLHRTQMSRAEHFATLGELATGLAHEIRNPLAGIAGVIEIVGRDLPSTSPAKAVVKDVREEVARINHI